MQLAITQNPHVKDPKHLWKTLESYDKEPVDDKLDKVGFEVFKRKMAQTGRFIVK